MRLEGAVPLTCEGIAPAGGYVWISLACGLLSAPLYVRSRTSRPICSCAASGSDPAFAIAKSSVFVFNIDPSYHIAAFVTTTVPSWWSALSIPAVAAHRFAH
jgi:hypothetical protein